MENKRKKINNHFIQKAFAKNFSNNGLLKYTYYKPNSKVEDEKTFNVNEIDTSKHPIVKKKFYSREIEDEMNEIENDGIKVIKKIAYYSNNNIDNKISLNGKELYHLKFYFLLSNIRTNKIREFISNLNGDHIFIDAVKKDKRSVKDIQESQIKTIIDEYKRYKKKELLLSTKFFDRYWESENHSSYALKDCTPEKIVLFTAYNIMKSRLHIFKFNKNKLFLHDGIAFSYNHSCGGIITFMPISPNIGIMFYLDPPITIKSSKWDFFKIDILEKKVVLFMLMNIKYSKKKENLLVKKNLMIHNLKKID